MNNKLQVRTPDGINSMTLEKVLECIPDLPGNLKKETILRNYIKVYDILGMKLDPDAAFTLIDPCIKKQIVAVAGAGKTTFMQIFILLMKIFWENFKGEPLYGKQVLCLVYNDSGVYDLINRHDRMISKFNRSGILNKNLDDHLEVSTLHAFANKWIHEYPIQSDIAGKELITSYEVDDMFEESLAMISKIRPVPELDNTSVLQKCYNLQKSLMVDLDDRRLSSLYEYIGFNEELTRMVFKTYDVRKNNYKKYDYSDMLYFFHRMIKENKSVLSRIQTNYKLVVVDECQDWTPLMQDIVDILSNGIDYMQVGDEDQTLYGFNGAEVLGMLNFDEKFKGKTYLLTENRRCPEIIVQAANIIIGDNKQRFHKEIFTKKPGGTIDIKYYKDYTEQLSMVIKQLSSYTMEELENTVVSYRNQYNSILLSEYLYEMGIPFKILGDKSLFEYRLYHHMFTVLDMLNNPHEDERQINLYKVTSLRKSEIKDILGLDKKRSFTRFTGYTNFYDRDFGNISTRKEFNDEINLLKEISTNIDSFPMKTYMWGIWNLFEKHYWNYQLSEAAKKSDYDGTDLIMLNRVKKFFDSDLPYYQFVREYVEKKKLYEDSVRSGQCVTLSTFHSLKGLQYKRQIMLFLDDATFPAMKSIHLENATEEELEDAFEAETRLAYVAMTRPTDELILYAKEDNPSIYVKKIQEFLSTYKPKTSLTSSKSIDMLMKPKSSLNLNKRF